jgi:hypothetical protein
LRLPAIYQWLYKVFVLPYNSRTAEWFFM